MFIVIHLTEDVIPDPGTVSGSWLARPRPRPRPRPLRLDGGARLGRQLRQRRLQLAHAAPRRPAALSSYCSVLTHGGRLSTYKWF